VSCLGALHKVDMSHNMLMCLVIYVYLVNKCDW